MNFFVLIGLGDFVVLMVSFIQLHHFIKVAIVIEHRMWLALACVVCFNFAGIMGVRRSGDQIRLQSHIRQSGDGEGQSYLG